MEPSKREVTLEGRDSSTAFHHGLLERGCQQREPGMVFLNAEPEWKVLLQRVGFTD
jgi:hypothetical protein